MAREKPLFGYLNLMHGSTWAEKHLSKLPQPRLVSELTWLEEMCDNQYWHRLWIIQEISNARNIEDYCGGYLTHRMQFIGELKANPKFSESVPLKLQKQIEEKHRGGHKLLNLLVSHQDALCQDPTG